MGKEQKGFPSDLVVNNENSKEKIMIDKKYNNPEQQLQRVSTYVKRMRVELPELIETYKNFNEEALIKMLEEECDPIEFGHILTFMRTKYIGLTRTDFSERLGISRTHAINIEYGRALPSSKLRKRIIHVFKAQFNLEDDDLQDALYFKAHPEATKDLDSARLKKIQEMLKISGPQQDTATVKAADMENRNKSASGKPNQKKKDSTPTVNGFYQWIKPMQEMKCQFIMDPPILDERGYEYDNLMSYYYMKEDEKSEVASYGDCLIINPDKKYGSEKDFFLFERIDDKTHFVGRLYIDTNDNGIHEAVTTIIRTEKYYNETEYSSIEQQTNIPCKCLGQIIHIKRDLSMTEFDFLKEYVQRL